MEHKRRLRNHFLFEIIVTYLNQLTGFLKGTMNVKRAVLNNFAFYCQCKDLKDLKEIDKDFINGYIQRLAGEKNYKKNCLRKSRSQIRIFFNYLVENGQMSKNPLTLKKEHFLLNHMKDYTQLLKNNGYTIKGIQNIHAAVNKFIVYLKEKNIQNLKEIDEACIDNYCIWLSQKPLSKDTTRHFNPILRDYFNYLIEKGLIEKNPCIKKKDPHFLSEYIEGYLIKLKKRGYREDSVRANKFALNNFVYYLMDKNLHCLKEIDKPIVEKFSTWLKAKKLQKETVKQNNGHVRLFFRYLYKSGRIETNPFPEKEKPNYPPDFMKSITEYIKQKEFENTCKESMKNITRSLNLFYRFLTERELTSHSEIKKDDLKDFIKYLVDLTDDKGNPVYMTVSVNRLLANLKQHIQWLSKRGIVASGFSSCITYLRQIFQIQRNILTRKELVSLFSIKVKPSVAFMMKAIFIVQYASGLRISELLNIELKDIDFENHTLSIFESKTNKERTVQIGEVGTKIFKDIY